MGLWFSFSGVSIFLVDSFYTSVVMYRRRALKMVAGELLINCFHLRVCKLGICHAIDGSRVQQVLGLFGIQYVPQTLLGEIVLSK